MTRIRHVLAVLVAVLACAATMWQAAGAAQDDERTIKVQVKDQIEEGGKSTRVPVAGVAARVVDASGAVVGEGVTDDKGVLLIPVPGPADYTVILDESTLPEGTALTDQTPAERAVSEDGFRTSTITVNYFTGESERDEVTFIDKLAQRSVDGTRLGLILAMCAVGLSLIFGTTGLTNFAHGEMVTFGGMWAFLFNVSWGLSLWIAGPIVVVLGGVFGLLLDTLLFARLRRRGIGLVSQLVVTVGLSILFRNFYLSRFGGRVRELADFNGQKNLDLGPVGITPRDLIAALMSLGVLIAVALVLQHSRLGKATRAVSDNPELASTTGIDSQKIIRIVWFVGGALAALGGIFRGLDEGIGPDMGLDLLFLMFAGITLGGLGSPFGALVGGFVVGVFVEASTLFGVPTELKKVPALVVLVLILLLRPQGILGRRERIG
jgi:branched-chain amino acid transport system permease protein